MRDRSGRCLYVSEPPQIGFVTDEVRGCDTKPVYTQYGQGVQERWPFHRS